MSKEVSIKDFESGFKEYEKSVIRYIQGLVAKKEKQFKCGASKYMGCDGDMCCDGERDRVAGYNQALVDVLKELEKQLCGK